MTVLFVEYPKCSTCKKAKAWLDEHGVEYVDRDIVTDNPSAEELATWIARSGLPVRRFFNSSGMEALRESGDQFELEIWDALSAGGPGPISPPVAPIRVGRRSLRTCRTCRSSTLRP